MEKGHRRRTDTRNKTGPLKFLALAHTKNSKDDGHAPTDENGDTIPIEKGKGTVEKTHDRYNATVGPST